MGLVASSRIMSDLTAKEQCSIRTTMLFLCVRAGGSRSPVAKALGVEVDTIAKVVHGRRPLTARRALRVARLIEVGVEDLLAGRHMLSPEDFLDKETLIADRPPIDEFSVRNDA